MTEAEFDAFAASYDEDLARGLSLTGEGKLYYARRRVEWLRRCLDRDSFTARRVLDFGCGTGTSLPLLREVLGAELVVGVDPSEASLRAARAAYGGPGIELIRPDECPPDASFDLAFANGVLHHVPLAERAAVIGRVAAALRPGGRFACWENNPFNPGTRWIMSRVAFDRDAVMLAPGELARRMREGGLAVLSTHFLFVFPRALGLLRRLEPGLARLPLGGQYQVLARKPGPGA